jgi:hypothetical protein
MIAKANLFEPLHKGHADHPNDKKSYRAKFSLTLAMDNREEIGSCDIEE